MIYYSVTPAGDFHGSGEAGRDVSDAGHVRFWGAAAIVLSVSLATSLIATQRTFVVQGTEFVVQEERRRIPPIYLRIDGEVVPLSDLRGRIVVIEVAATWCTACHKLVPRLAALQAAYREEMTVVSVITDLQDPRTLEQFRDSYPEINYTLALLPTPQAAPRESGVGSISLDREMLLPTLWLFDRDGRLAGRYVSTASIPRLEYDIERLLDEERAAS